MTQSGFTNSQIGNVSSLTRSLISDTQQLSITSTKDYGIMFVGNLRAIFVVGNPSVNDITVQVTWFADQTGQLILASDKIDITNQRISYEPIRVKSAWMRVQVLLSGQANATYSLSVWSIPDYGTVKGNAVIAGEISQSSALINAGATLTFDSTIVLSGPAVWVAFMTGGNWGAVMSGIPANFPTVSERFLDSTNNSQIPPTSRPIYLPPMTIRIKITNNSAAQQAFNLFLSRLRE